MKKENKAKILMIIHNFIHVSQIKLEIYKF